jgi:hypothetical protein
MNPFRVDGSRWTVSGAIFAIGVPRKRGKTTMVFIGLKPIARGLRKFAPAIA